MVYQLCQKHTSTAVYFQFGITAPGYYAYELNHILMSNIKVNLIYFTSKISCSNFLNFFCILLTAHHSPDPRLEAGSSGITDELR